METASEVALQDCDLEDSMMEREAKMSDEEFEPTNVKITKENVKFILMDGYQYCFNRMLGNAQRWKCSNTSCYAYFKIWDNKVLPGVMEHCHPRKGEVSCQDELKGMPVQVQVLESSQMPAQVQVLESSEMPKVVRPVRKKRKYTSKLNQSPMVDNANLPYHPSCASGSVKKKLAGQWSLKSMGSTPAGCVKSNSVLVLPRNTWQAHPGYGPTSTSPAMPLSPSLPSDLPRTPSPAKSPKLSEMGPPPTPPPSQPSPSPQLDDPCSPSLADFDLSELECTPSADSPADYDFSQPSISQWTLPEEDSDHVSLPEEDSDHVSAAPPQPTASESERFKYKEYEDMMMQLNNSGFGHAVTSLLNELSSQAADQVRSEIATLLYNAVEHRKA